MGHSKDSWLNASLTLNLPREDEEGDWLPYQFKLGVQEQSGRRKQFKSLFIRKD